LSDFLSSGALFALFQVIMIDIVLAGDNALVIGMSASQVAKKDRNKVIFWGLTIAVVLRIVLAVFTVHLLKFDWVMLAGGLLLLWVCWRLFCDIRHPHSQAVKSLDAAAAAGEIPTALPHAKAMQRAVVSIAAADVSMSLDNVLAVAGAAMQHIEVLVIGLTLSIALMGLAANLIARLLNRYHWISYIGVAIVFYVALTMVWHGFERMQQAGYFDRMAGQLSALF
jgi:YjbE family integral membrane protein